MIDPFVILAPVLLLAVVALLRFVGCAAILGLDDVQYTGAPAANPQPQPTGLDPPSKFVCEGQFTLKVLGTGFVNGSVVQWNDGSNPLLSLTTRLVSGHLEADVPANLIEELAPGPPGGSAVKKTVKVTVFNPAPGGGTSPPLTFDIVPGTPNIVRFDPKPPQVANSGDILNGSYKNLDFDISQWRWELRPNGSVISLTTSAPSRFSFVNGKRVLASVVVFPTVVGQIKLSDGGVNLDKSLSFTSAEVGSFQTVPTNWTKCAKTVQVQFISAAPQLPVLEITYLGPP